MSLYLLPSRVAVLSGIGLLGLVAVLWPNPQPAHAQAQPPIQDQSSCPCSCALAPQAPTGAMIGSNGVCQCPCGTAVPIPGINVETLSGPPKPPKAGGPAPTWTVEPGFEDGFGGPFWDDWW